MNERSPQRSQGRKDAKGAEVREERQGIFNPFENTDSGLSQAKSLRVSLRS
jgi:hypothetical protein